MCDDDGIQLVKVAIGVLLTAILLMAIIGLVYAARAGFDEIQQQAKQRQEQTAEDSPTPTDNNVYVEIKDNKVNSDNSNVSINIDLGSPLNIFSLLIIVVAIVLWIRAKFFPKKPKRLEGFKEDIKEVT